MTNLDTCFSRNTLAVCALAAGVGAVEGVRPGGGELLPAYGAHPVRPRRKPSLPLMLPVAQLGAPAVAVPLGVDSRVEDAPTPLAVDLPHRRVRGFACDLIQIPLFQQLLVFLFPLAVVPHRFVTIPYLFENRLNFS